MKFLLLAFVLLFRLPAVWACSCVTERLPEAQKIAKARAQASLVFTGRVESTAVVTRTDSVHFRTRAGADTLVISRQQYLQVTFTIREQLKGRPVAGTVAVLTAGSGAACGASFQVGTDYLVYAYRVEEAYSSRVGMYPVRPYFATDLCTRNKELRATSAAELRQLQELAHHD
jgi:hypothetical protein